METRAIFLYLFLVFAHAATKKGKPKTMAVMRAEVLEECPATPPKKITLSWIHLENLPRGRQVVNINATVAENIPELILSATVSVCKSVKDKNCELLYNGRFDACQVFRDFIPMMPGILAFQPHLDAPLKKGVYTLRNFTFDAEEFLLITKQAIPNVWTNYIKIKGKFLDKKDLNKVLFCVKVITSMNKIRL